MRRHDTYKKGFMLRDFITILLFMSVVAIAKDDAWEELPNAKEIKEIEKDFDEYMSKVLGDRKKRVHKVRGSTNKGKGSVRKVLPK